MLCCAVLEFAHEIVHTGRQGRQAGKVGRSVLCCALHLCCAVLLDLCCAVLWICAVMWFAHEIFHTVLLDLCCGVLWIFAVLCFWICALLCCALVRS